MRNFDRRVWSPLLLAIVVLLGNTRASKEAWLPEEIESVCNTDDLNHSKLVGCHLTQCDEAAKPDNLLTVDSNGKVLHMFSSRSGERFSLDLLNSLDNIETDYEKSMDINTTLYVDTKGKHREIYGFGTSLNLESISDKIDDVTFQTIIRQLFSQENEGLKLSLLRISLSRETLSEGRVMSVLNMIDDILAKALGDGVRVKLVLSFAYWPSTAMEDIRALETVSFEGLKSLECWSVAIPYLSSQGIVAEGLRDFIRDRCFGTNNMFSQVPMSNAVHYVRELSPEIKGLLVQSDFESNYGNLDKVISLKENLSMITIGSPKSLIGDYGNWQTAQHHALEIMNHLKHDSSGFIETDSVVDIFSSAQGASKDGSIYNLGTEHESYFIGPIFYAMGHFSKHLPPGSRRLDSELSTQPNMFAADYMAFITPRKHVVVTVLNDNEHDLPFRFAIDQRIRLHVMLKSKSFNTFVIKP